MTLGDFIRNPIGKGDASTNKQLLMVALDHKYLAWLSKRGDTLKFIPYRNSSSSEYYLWFIVPSETDRTNTYDIIFRFYDPDGTHRKELSVKAYDIQIFSNVPSFAYTYAYVYNKNRLIIEELKPKLGKIFFDKEPVVRNQRGITMYDKYVYYIAKYILDKKYMNRAILETKCKICTNKKLFFAKVRSLKQIKSEYHIAQQRLNQTKQPSTKQKHTTTSKNTTSKSGIIVVNKNASNKPKKMTTNTGSTVHSINKNKNRKRGIH